jgi:hypothetical protein
MGWHEFVDRLTHLQQTRQTDIALFLNPRPLLLPHPIQRYDDPYLPFGKAIINATHDLVCAYVFDLASYLGMGAAGAVALERTVAYAAQEALTILHAPFVGQAYSATADTTGFGVDAITLAHAADLPHYLTHPPYAAFALGNEATLPDEGGVFIEEQQRFRLRGLDNATLQLRLTDDRVLYTDGTEDFAAKIRAVVEQMR